jgi:small subunit ribosomal protein S17
METKNNNKTKKRQLVGVVVSDKMQKTRVVRVDRLKKHPRYQKYFRVSRKFKAHDENNEYKVGDKVIIQETRPLSRHKRWIIVGLVESGRKIEKANLELENLELEEEVKA